jgi:hypothetical protein
MKKIKNIIIFSLIVLFIIFLMVFFIFISPEEIVRKIGVNNSYLFVFLVSFLAGFSAWTSFSVILVLFTFVYGGINPFYLGIISGFGLIIGDIIMFILGSKGRSSISGKWKKRLDKLAIFFKGRFNKFLPFLIYLYLSISPFPNDFLIIFLTIIKYPFKRLYIPLILGDLTYPLILTFLASKGISLL